MRFRDEVEVQLESLSRERVIALAARTGLRCLLLLGADQGNIAFSYWPETKRVENLLALFRTCCAAYWLPLEHVAALSAAFASAKKINFSRSDFKPVDRESLVQIATNVSNSCNVAYDTLNDAPKIVDAVVKTIANVASATAQVATFFVRKSRVKSVFDVTCCFCHVESLADQSAYIASYLSYYEKSDALNSGILHVVDFLNQPLCGDDDWQGDFANFKLACQSLGAGFDVWIDWFEDRLLGNRIDFDMLEKWNNVPAEVDAQGPAEVNAYLFNLYNRTGTAPLNRVRAIFIGHGEAGKTSLIRVLNGQPVIESKELMTPGIAISDWSVPNTQIKASFWDFGGQVMAHATHQFFLRERCLYVLMINARSEINATEQAEYWLEHVKSFGKNAPVMIVGNKADLAKLNLDMAYLTHKYVNIVNYYPLSCTEAKGAYQPEYQTFLRDFCTQLKTGAFHFSVLKSGANSLKDVKA